MRPIGWLSRSFIRSPVPGAWLLTCPVPCVRVRSSRCWTRLERDHPNETPFGALQAATPHTFDLPALLCMGSASLENDGLMRPGMACRAWTPSFSALGAPDWAISGVALKPSFRLRHALLVVEVGDDPGPAGERDGWDPGGYYVAPVGSPQGRTAPDIGRSSGTRIGGRSVRTSRDLNGRRPSAARLSPGVVLCGGDLRTVARRVQRRGANFYQ